MEEKRVTVTDEDGNELCCDVLYTLENEETGATYLLYTDHSEDEEGCEQIFASRLDPEAEEGDNLLPVETDEEWDYIEKKLDELEPADEAAE